MASLAEVIERTRIVKRTIVPLMSDDPVPGQRRRFGLSAEDLQLVVEGRACPECLACWESPVLLKCPVCQHERSPRDIIDGVQEWEDFLRHRQQQLDNPEQTKVLPAHEIVEQISREHGVKPR